METLGKVSQVNSFGTSIGRMVQQMEEKKIVPTHFLLVNFSYDKNLPKKYHQSIPQTLFQFINNQVYTILLNARDPDDKISIKWQSFNSSSSIIYWTISRFDEQYVQQSTKALLRRAVSEILTTLNLRSNDFQLTSIVMKNLNYAINLQTKEEQAMEVLRPYISSSSQIVIEQEEEKASSSTQVMKQE